MTGRLPHAGDAEPSLVVRGHRETVSWRSVFQRGSSLQQSTDEMLSSVFEYVKGATISRCEEAETPAVAVSEIPVLPSPLAPAQAGEALNFFTTLAFQALH